MSQKMSTFIQDNGRKIAIVGAVVAGVAGLGYLVSRAISKDTSDADSKTDISANQSALLNFDKSNNYREAIKAIRDVLEKTDGQIPNIRVLQIIVMTTVELYRPRLISLYKMNRQERRLYLNDPDRYAEKVQEGSALGEQIFTDATAEVLQDAGISQEHYEQQIELASAQNPNFGYYIIGLYQQVKISAVPDKIVKPTVPQVLQFFQLQIEELDRGSLAMFDHLPEETAIMCKQTYLNDVAATKLGFEEEHIAQDKALLNDPAVIHKQQELVARTQVALGLQSA